MSDLEEESEFNDSVSSDDDLKLILKRKLLRMVTNFKTSFENDYFIKHTTILF